jgi:mannitol-1-phosphate 5-dehydrogenase
MGAKHLALFGAGMTGRGQVAQLAYEDGWSLTLIDSNAELVDLLRRQGRYTVHLVSENAVRQVVVEGFQTLHTGETEAIAAAVQEADLVATSVLEPNLPAVANALAPALLARLEATDRPLNIVAAENMLESSTLLKGYVQALVPESIQRCFTATFGFPNSMIARVVPIAQDPLHIWAESYSEWTADRLTVLGHLPELNGLEWVTNQSARLMRKLYTANTAHVICAYLGWLAGYEYIHEAAQNPAIVERFMAAVGETRLALSAEAGFSYEDLLLYGESLRGRLASPLLPDSLARVIRQPVRKLGQNERLLGPLLLCVKHGLPRPALCYGIAAVLAASQPPTRLPAGDEQFLRLREAVANLGPLGALRELVDFQPDELTEAEIIAAYHTILAHTR